MRILKVSWEEYGKMINALGEKIKDLKVEFDGIYGIPRGGLVMATSLSHQLNLPILFYPTENTLVVDDISDTGNTLIKVKSKLIVTLFSTDWTIAPPNIFVDKKLNKEEWIVFPWEEEMKERQTTLDEFTK